MTNCAVISALIDQPTTRLENRSSTTAKYSQPCAVQMYVKSATQRWFGAAASRATGSHPRNRIISQNEDIELRRRLAPAEKPLFWIGSSKADLRAMPEVVVRHIGSALSAAQYGGKHPDAKPWKGLGPGVFEVVSDFRTDTFRAAYVVKFQKAVYVLHCFQKKSPSGVRTAQVDVNLIEQRLKAARSDYEERYGQAKK